MNNENFNIAPNDENEEFTVEFGEIFNDGGTHDYNELDNKPQINGNTLDGNKTNEQLGIPVYTEGTGITLSGNTISADTDVLATKADLNSKQNVIADLPQIRSGAEAGATAVQPEDLARIATTGSYNDSLDKPSINNVTLTGNKSLDALGIQPKGDYALESEIPDVSNFITKDVNNLTNYTLKTNTGSLIDLEINDTTYVVTLKLKNQDGTVISTDTIDLPLESVVVSGSYDETNKKIVLTLQSGDTVDIPVGALISGLQSEITSSNKLASDLVDDSNSGNKFVTTSEKQTWNGKANISDIPTKTSQLTNDSNYVTNTDYATAEKGGTIRTSNANGLGIANGNLYAVTKAYNTYNSASGNMFIGKGTLENVITGKGLENKYSRSEIKTGTWIDNKPVYRRVFTIDLGAAPNIAQAHSLTDLDKFWINQSASFVVSSYESLPSTWYYSSADWARTWLTNTNIRFRSPVDLTNRVLYVTVEYTKTTD